MFDDSFNLRQEPNEACKEDKYNESRNQKFNTNDDYGFANLSFEQENYSNRNNTDPEKKRDELKNWLIDLEYLKNEQNYQNTSELNNIQNINEQDANLLTFYKIENEILN